MLPAFAGPGLIGLALALFASLPLQAQPLRVERVDLGEAAASGEQAYKLQEGRTLRVFARSQAGFKGSKLYLQRRAADGAWLPPEPLPFADARWRDSDPQLSEREQRLSFVSDRGAAEGRLPRSLDLYESRWDGSRWSAPQRLAEPLQSPAYELGPARHGEQQFFFASSRPGGPGRLAVYRAGPGDAAPQPLPAPINVGADNSDFSLTPDGRYALWWSSRDADAGDGDLYLAERLGQQGFGPALRLPAPVNSAAAMEFGPSVSADGRWLYFASTRDDAQGLAHVYRVGWPELLQSLGPAAQAHSQAALDAAVSALWRAFGHERGAAPDTQRLAQLLHPQAQIFGQALQDGAIGVQRWSAAEFIQDLAQPGAASAVGFQECELQREQRREGGHALVYSVVESRFDAGSGRAPYVGVNSMQWQLGEAGWQLLSLHYALPLPALAPRPGERCRG